MPTCTVRSSVIKKNSLRQLWNLISEHGLMRNIFIIIFAVLALVDRSYGFEIRIKGSLSSYGQPIHENITALALENSKIFANLSPSDQTAAFQHVLEGVRFNDDPEGFFLDSDGMAGRLSSVLQFISNFLDPDDDELFEPTKASHFGSFQYLHSMGIAGQSRDEIKRAIERYMYHCWRMVSEPNSLENLKMLYEIMVNEEPKSAAMPSKGSTFDVTQENLKALVSVFPRSVLFFHSKNQTEFQNRALGSMIHLIQDSFAKGHTVREGWDSENSGKVRYFQDYSAQSSKRHKAFDSLSHKEEHFLSIPGSTTAYDRTKALLVLIKNKCPWDSTNEICPESVSKFINTKVFALAEESAEDHGATQSHPSLVKPPKDNSVPVNPDSSVFAPN